MSTEKPKGITCICGAEHPFSAWVYAHWDIDLVLKCPCGREWALLRGEATIYTLHALKKAKRERK